MLVHTHRHMTTREHTHTHTDELLEAHERSHASPELNEAEEVPAVFIATQHHLCEFTMPAGGKGAAAALSTAERLLKVNMDL